MSNKNIVPINISKLGFRYFRILVETKRFSRKFIDYVINHPNTGYVFIGSGWSGKKQVLGIGIWATDNAEMSDIATNIRSVMPDAYKVVYQSELTRLEYFKNINGERRSMILLDELEQKRKLSAIELDYLKLLSVDGSLSMKERAAMLGLSEVEVTKIDNKLQVEGVFHGVFLDGSLPQHYTKFFVDTTALSHESVELYFNTLKNDPNCVYLARGNGVYNVEFEYVLADEEGFEKKYGSFLRHSKHVNFHTNLFTNLFPQSKSLNTKIIQERFIAIANRGVRDFDFTESELWYVNHEGTQSYLDIYDNAEYRQFMNVNETGLFSKVCEHLTQVSHKFTVIDLGSGDGVKGRDLIHELGEDKVKSYFPVDVQELELSQAVYAHEGAEYVVHPTIIDFRNLTARFPLASVEGEMNIYALLGGTYGNFDVSLINHYLSPLLATDKDRLLISMPIRDMVTRQSIVDSYLSAEIENMAFGVLKQIGFSKDEFVVNPKKPNLIVQVEMRDDHLQTSFILKRSKQLLGLYVEAGTIFNITSSWKPTLAEFRAAVESDLDIEEMFSNRSFAIAICKKKVG